MCIYSYIHDNSVLCIEREDRSEYECLLDEEHMSHALKGMEIE